MGLYKLLRAGVRQRGEAGWSKPKVGDVINVSDLAAPRLMREGWIEPTGRREKTEEKAEPKRRRGWLGGEKPEPTETQPEETPEGEAKAEEE